MVRKERVMITIDGEVRRQIKRTIGLIPFSRFVEDLLRKEIDRRNKHNSEVNTE